MLQDVTPLTLKEKLKLTLFGVVGTASAILWFFGAFIGAVIAAVHNDLLSLVLSIFIPGFGAIYTVISLITAIF
ncbi:MAG: PGF-CTERM sorting domain-containing protein [Alphaproteobacteria bacterium]|nr:PGF-CTERM sorting domain-containing protein [Alphaproteobacteria bacterium]MCD8525693.1 PGF-CTERM sorting domain-containing protein [Alphaproteobacteria bacterium]